MSEEGSGARLVRNTLANGGASVIGVLVFLVLTPFMILELGATAYGVFTLALSLSFLGGYAAFTDLGVEAATARFIAESRADGDVQAANRIASTTLAFFGAAAVVLAPAIALLAPLLVDLFSVRGALRDEAVWCFALVGGQLLFEMPARTYFAVLEGTQRFTWFQACEMTRLVSQAAMFVVVLVADLSIAWLGASLMASSLIVLVVARTLAHRVMPELRVSPRQASRTELRRLLGFGGGLVILRLTGTMFRQMDRVIIATAMGPRSVTVYEIANKIQAAAQMVQSVAASALVPAAAFARARIEVLQDMFLRGNAYSLAVAIPFAGAVGIFAEPLIRTWIDPRYVEAASATRLFAVYLLLAGLLVVGTTMAVALGHLRFFILINVPVILVNLVISILLVGPLGIDGVVLGSVIPYALSFPLQLRFLLRRFELSLGQWLRGAILPNLPGAAVQAATAVPLLALAADVHTVIEAGLIALVSIALSIATFVMVGLSRSNRDVLLRTVRDALGMS